MARPLTDEERAFFELQEKEQKEEEKVEVDVSPTRRTIAPPSLIFAAKARDLADTFADSLYGSTQATIGDYQETRARRQEGLGQDDFSRELLKTASSRVCISS